MLSNPKSTRNKLEKKLPVNFVNPLGQVTKTLLIYALLIALYCPKDDLTRRAPIIAAQVDQPGGLSRMIKDL
jgi:hypothetical protein